MESGCRSRGKKKRNNGRVGEEKGFRGGMRESELLETRRC